MPFPPGCQVICHLDHFHSWCMECPQPVDPWGGGRHASQRLCAALGTPKQRCRREGVGSPSHTPLPPPPGTSPRTKPVLSIGTAQRSPPLALAHDWSHRCKCSGSACRGAGQSCLGTTMNMVGTIVVSAPGAGCHLTGGCVAGERPRRVVPVACIPAPLRLAQPSPRVPVDTESTSPHPQICPLPCQAPKRLDGSAREATCSPLLPLPCWGAAASASSDVQRRHCCLCALLPLAFVADSTCAEVLPHES